MRDYIILNGVNSNTITGLLISKLPPITKPKQRTQIEEIDGRDGDIVTKLGYSAYDKEIEIGLYGDFDIDDVIAYFNSEGTVTFSNEPDKFYNYQILDQIDYEKLIRFKKAKVKMHVQPFKYLLEETPVEITNQYVNNEAEEMDLDNTKEAPMTIALKGNTSQNGTPTPEAPIEVSVVSGDNSIVVCGKNLFDGEIELGSIDPSNGSLVANNLRTRSANFTKVKPNTTYYYKRQNGGIRWIVGYKSDKTGIIDGNFTGQASGLISVTSGTLEFTFTTSPTTEYIKWYDTANTDLTEQVMISIDDIPYEPYQSASYPINLPVEQLLDTTKIVPFTPNSIGWRDFKGELLGTPTQITSDTLTYRVKANQNYRFTIYEMSNIASVQILRIVNGNFDAIGTLDSITGVTINLASDTDLYFRCRQTSVNVLTTIKCMLEKGTKSNTYQSYRTTPIWLGGMGDYKDTFFKAKEGDPIYDSLDSATKQTLDSNEWYLEKKIGKAQVSLSEPIYNIGNYKGAIFTPSISKVRAILGLAYCNKSLIALNSSQRVEGRFYENPLNYMFIGSSTDTITKLKEKYDGSDFYYPIATPTATKITDETLIAQLEALKNASSYDTKTHITQNANDKPFILNATALQQGSGEATVNNEGNIYSKPTIDIEGSGTVGIYLDGNQMFSVDLSNATECIIDTAQLEAYNPSTSELMNRQVTGDYSNFKLNAGENQVSTTGEITKVTISNYTRWL